MTKPDDYYQIHTDRYRYILNTIKNLNLAKNSKVLDIGCYPPYLSQHLTESGFDVFGISSKHESIKNSKIKVLNIETDSLPYSENTYDLVILTEVIEHLSTNIFGIFKEIYRVLKPGGYILITTPNVLRIHNLISLLINKNIYFNLDQLDQPLNFRHQREYTLNEIVYFCLKSNLKIIIAKNFIGYTPFRQKNNQDNFFLKISKLFIFIFSSIFKSRADSILVVSRK